MKQGLIQIYTGDGKGKTTAAVGQAVRAWGRGLKVKVFQFLKGAGGSGEHWALLSLRPILQTYPLGSGEFIQDRLPTAKEIAAVVDGWKQVEEAINTGNCDVIVIDEISHVINKGMLSLCQVIAVLKEKPVNLELVLTGRNMPAPILELADLVTEMKQIKHPYQKGIAAREGIEY